jgi:Protein of unknown function (DUF2510)
LTPPRRFLRRPSRAVAIGMIVVAVLGGVFAIVEIVRTFVSSFDGPSIAVPGTTTVHLDDGRWIVFELVGTRVSEDPTFDGPTTIGVPDVHVVAPDGESLEVREVTGTQTINRNSAHFVGAVEFVAPRTGDYEITVRGESGSAMLARPLTDTFGRAALWFLFGFVCFALLVVGIVFTVLGPAKPKPAYPTAYAPYPPMGRPIGPQPGWYADPYGGTDLRWWDGARWTDQVRAP